MAKSFIDSFLEQATLSGQVSPPVGIFLLKNWCSYKDTISLEDATNTTRQNVIAARTPAEIAASYGVTDTPQLLELPEVPE